MSKIGIMICGHGSRDKDAEKEFGLIATNLKKRYVDVPVEYGFLEYSAPNIHMGLDSLVSQGVTEIFAVPGMLLAATHAKNDIPSVLTTYEEKHAELKIHYGEELGIDTRMLTAFKSRIKESLNVKQGDDLTDTMLVVVGRGTSDAYANADVAKITRIVCEDMGFGWSDVVYSGVTYPSTGVGLEMLSKLGFKKIVVAPYFLFTGRLIKRITNYVNEVREKFPDIQFYQAQYLKDHEKVIDAFVGRIEDLRQGGIKPKGLMEDFKKRLANGEVDVHHHHAEFNPNVVDETQESFGHAHDADGNHIDDKGNIIDDGGHHKDKTHDHSHKHSGHSKDHTHGHSHGGHGHHHAPYKHIAHPLGPRTMIGTKNCCCFMGQFPQEIIDEELMLQNRD